MAKRLKYIAYEGFPENDEALYEMMRNMSYSERFEMCIKMSQRALNLKQPKWDDLEWHVLRKREKE